LTIDTQLTPLVMGESISVMGVCLTVDQIRKGGFEADASSETLQRSTLGKLAIGSSVHLERAVVVGGRLGGHIVSGHVDGTTLLLQRRAVGQSVELTYGLQADVAPYVAPKGSIAIDGVSLTVNAVDADRFTLMVVPHTQQATLLGAQRPGIASNLETDVLARYVVRFLEASQGRPTVAAEASYDEALMKRLVSAGFL
jgi:riboflavin synthase